PRAGGVEDSDVGVGADHKGAFAWVQAVAPGRRRGDEMGQLADVHAAPGAAVLEEQGQERLDAGQPRLVVEDVWPVFDLNGPGGVVGAHKVDLPSQQFAPQLLLHLLGTQWWVALG